MVRFLRARIYKYFCLVQFSSVGRVLLGSTRKFPEVPGKYLDVDVLLVYSRYTLIRKGTI